MFNLVCLMYPPNFGITVLIDLIFPIANLIFIHFLPTFICKFISNYHFIVIIN